MACGVLILGASCSSLLGAKLLMAGHEATLVCRRETADLVNAEGTLVRIRLKGEDAHRAIRSHDLPGRLSACAPYEIARDLGMSNPDVDETVDFVDSRLDANGILLG